jgi:hypothetical protein
MAAPTKRGGIYLAQLPSNILDPVTYNTELDVSGVVYSQEITGPVHGFDIQASGSYDMKMSFSSGEIEAEKGWTVFAGSSYAREFDQPWPTLTVYLMTESDDGPPRESRGAQILVWRDLSALG